MTPYWAVSVNPCSISPSIAPFHQPTLRTTHMQRGKKRGQSISGDLFLFPVQIQQPVAPARYSSREHLRHPSIIYPLFERRKTQPRYHTTITESPLTDSKEL